MTPFCPCRDANLSPISGIRWSLTFTRARRVPYDSVMMTVSTIPFSFDRMVTEFSRRSCGASPVGSSINLGGDVFPTRTSPGRTSVSGLIRPSESRCAYASSPLAPLTSASGISNRSSCPPGYRCSSASSVLKKWLRPRPRSIEPLFTTSASSML